jgi:hypothetical protein
MPRPLRMRPLGYALRGVIEERFLRDAFVLPSLVSELLHLGGRSIQAIRIGIASERRRGVRSQREPRARHGASLGSPALCIHGVELFNRFGMCVLFDTRYEGSSVAAVGMCIPVEGWRKEAQRLACRSLRSATAAGWAGPIAWQVATLRSSLLPAHHASRRHRCPRGAAPTPESSRDGRARRCGPTTRGRSAAPRSRVRWRHRPRAPPKSFRP